MYTNARFKYHSDLIFFHIHVYPNAFFKKSFNWEDVNNCFKICILSVFLKNAFFDFWFFCKCYKTGLMSQYIKSWKTGDAIFWRGPFGGFDYTANQVIPVKDSKQPLTLIPFGFWKWRGKKSISRSPFSWIIAGFVCLFVYHKDSENTVNNQDLQCVEVSVLFF